MTAQVELQQLLGLALGTPEVGAVNFNILHGVLREILKHLGIENKIAEIAEDGRFKGAFPLLKNTDEGTKTERASETDSNKQDDLKSESNKNAKSAAAFRAGFPEGFPGEFGNLESKLIHIEKRLEMLDDIPSNSEILQRAKQKKEARTPVGDMWQFININRRLGATETGIEKLTSLLDNMMSEVNDIKELAGGIEYLKKKLSELEKQNTSLADKIKALEGVDNSEEKKKLEDLLQELENLKSRVDELPTKEDLDHLDIYVKWPQLEECLNARRTRTPTPKPRTPTPTPPSRTPSPTPLYPSEEALEALRQVGELMETHEVLTGRVDELEDEMPKKANLEDLEDLKNRPAVPADIVDQLKRLRDDMDAINKWKKEGGGAIDSLRNMLLDLQSDHEKLNITTKELIEEENRKQKHLDALYSYCDKLQDNKADKEQVAMEIDVKADKRSMDNLVGRLKFDQTVSTLDQAIQDLLNRLDGYDSGLKDALAQLNEEVDRKIDRMELDPLRDYFEKKIKGVKCKHADLPQPLNDDPAAGFRKAMLRFHCISCDRPVSMAPEHPNPALPVSPGLPPSRTGRPYTTFELDQIRQMNRGGMAYDQDVISTARSCGGSHTVTYPHRRTTRLNQYYYFREDDVVPVPVAQRDETEIVGHDGHIYRGSHEGDNQPFPEVPSSPRHNPKSPRTMSAKRSTSPQPPRNGSPTYRRPRSAVPSSPRSRGEGAEPPTEIPAQ